MNVRILKKIGSKSKRKVVIGDMIFICRRTGVFEWEYDVFLIRIERFILKRRRKKLEILRRIRRF